jgi:hypothetical protein
MNETNKIISQEVAIQAVRNKRFIIGSVGVNGNISFAINPAIHTDEYSAREECDRLARTNPGIFYTYVKLSGAVMYPLPSKISI